MFTTILCATDGSEHADRALRYATDLARQDHSQLHVAHVIERLVGGRLTGQNVFLDESEIDDSLKAQTAKIVNDSGVNTTLHVARDTPRQVAARLADIADVLDADVIVIGSRGHTPLGGLMLGSVGQRLLHVSSRPVLAVPPTRHPMERSASAEQLRSAA
jgi:nucleotide-binding universal stress UspA family protein